LWDYITLQACESEPCIRPLLIAVASLSKGRQELGHCAAHREYALVQYGIALR